MTSQRWSGVWQTDPLLVIKDRCQAWVAAPSPSRARTVARADRARIVQGRASTLHKGVSMEQEAVYVGIDVAKAQVDVAVRPTGQRWTISNDEPGIRELVSRLKALEPAMVVLEPTGGLELPSLPVAIVNPRQVRDFARATGTLAKTDALDAASLAHFADAVRPAVRPLKDAETQVLSSLVARRHQVITILVAEKEPAWERDQCRPTPDRGPHRLAQAGAERHRRRAAADTAQQSGVEGEG